MNTTPRYTTSFFIIWKASFSSLCRCFSSLLTFWGCIFFIFLRIRPSVRVRCVLFSDTNATLVSVPLHPPPKMKKKKDNTNKTTLWSERDLFFGTMPCLIVGRLRVRKRIKTYILCTDDDWETAKSWECSDHWSSIALLHLLLSLRINWRKDIEIRGIGRVFFSFSDSLLSLKRVKG